jgi:hypothetical protein
MEAFKFAFETVIVGILALPSLFIMLDLIFPALFNGKSEAPNRLAGLVSKELSATIASAFLLSMAYFLGSAISPLASEFLNDEHWAGSFLWTESDIRARVYCHEANLAIGTIPISREELRKYVIDFDEPNEATPPVNPDAICRPRMPGWSLAAQQIFDLQESSTLRDGAEKNERLKQLHEQLIVLRGAAFSGFVLFLLCLFGRCATIAKAMRLAPSHSRQAKIWKALVVGPSLALVGVALYSGLIDLRQGDVGDPPIMEFVLIQLGILGLVSLRRDVNPRAYLTGLLLGLFVTSLAYGGWVWTEVTYDKQVINSFYVQKEAKLNALTIQPPT